MASAAKRRLPAASLRSAEIGRAADAAQARASPASLTDGEDAVGTSRASARRTSSPVVGIFRRLASLGVFPVAFFSSLSSLLLRLASLGVLLCCFSHRSHRAHRAHNAHRAHCPRRPPRKAHRAHCPRRPPRKAHRAHCPRRPPRKSHVPPSEAKSSLPHRTDGVFTARRRGRSPGQGEHELRYGTLFSDALKKRIVCRMIFWGLG